MMEEESNLSVSPGTSLVWEKDCRRGRRSSLGHHGLLTTATEGPSILAPPSSETSESMHMAAAEMLSSVANRRGRNSIVDAGPVTELRGWESFGTQAPTSDEGTPLIKKTSPQERKRLTKGLQQIPPILLVCLLSLMEGIPFGVALFPLGWKSPGASSTTDDADANEIHGDFPLAGKEALGIRMFLFSTIVSQIAFTFTSKFTSAVGLEMVENIPFWHALAYIVIEEQGYGVEALSTLLFLFGFSSVAVGILFYALGKLHLGRVVYYFPAHVLIGCIGGIGVFISVSAIEVTINSSFEFSLDGLKTLLNNMDLFGVVLVMEVTLRILNYLNHRTESKQPRCRLLAPLFFCLITPAFYFGLWIFGVSMASAMKAGYFFPASDSCSTSPSTDCEVDSSLWALILNENLFDMWRVFDFNSISWRAVFNSLPTVVALSAFSLIHVPINIPAFAISIDADTDMNAELIAHGFSNGFSGLFGGLQNYLCYSNSVLYAKSGGEGKASSLAVAACLTFLFLVGPHIGSFIPRCMAGTMLLHMGIDLITEGVYDSYGNFDNLEYAGIWVILIVMTSFGMTAALIAGIIAALSTYAFQSVTYLNPIRAILTAATLRSSSWDRSRQAQAILDDERIGRNKILLIQLQGHLFFGNVALMTDSIKETLNKVEGTDEEPWIIILDFTLIVGMDSSAAHAIAKLKGILQKAMHLEVTVFVTGRAEGFPCQFDLSGELSRNDKSDVTAGVAKESGSFLGGNQHTLGIPRRSVSFAKDSAAMRASLFTRNLPRSRVCDDLDAALAFAEDVLIARADPGFTHVDEQRLLKKKPHLVDEIGTEHLVLSLDDELTLVEKCLTKLCPQAHSQDVSILVRQLKRESYPKGALVWNRGSDSCSAKLLIRGKLISYLDGNDAPELIAQGNFIGELGLVHGMKRLTTVECASESAVLYSLSKDAWESLSEQQPRVAQIMYMLVIRYLSHRVNHVSNRIFETRCLPI